MGQLKSAIEEWRSEEIHDLPREILADQLIELESAISGLEAERCRRLARYDSQRLSTDHLATTSAFLVDACRITPSRAARLVGHARSISEMSSTSQAWSDGVLSQDQVRALVTGHDSNPEVFADHEPGLVDTVSGLNVIDTGRAVGYWRRMVNEDRFEADQTRLHGLRRLHLSQTFEGMWRLDGWLDPEAGEIIRTALDAATPPPAEGDSRTPAQRRADGLYDLAREALDRGDFPEQGGERPHLDVVVNLSDDRIRSGETIDGSLLSQTVIDRLCCDAAIRRLVFGPDSEIIDVGRRTRVIPAALRRAVIARDRHCQNPGCYRPGRWCDIDHIIAWQDGGPTNLRNLQLLCRYHHTLKHASASRARDP